MKPVDQSKYYMGSDARRQEKSYHRRRRKRNKITANKMKLIEASIKDGVSPVIISRTLKLDLKVVLEIKNKMPQ